MSIQSEIDRIKAGKADAKAALIERGVDPGDATIDEYGNQIRAIPTGVTSFNGRTGAVEPQAGDYTAQMVGAIDQNEKGRASGVASLDADGKVIADQLPEMNYDPAGSAQAVQQELNTHAANKTFHVTDVERQAWNNKAAGTHTHTAAQVGALPISGGTMTGALNMNGKALTNLPTPKNNKDAVPKDYVDAILANVSQVEVVFGTYTGNGSEMQSINLGFKPAAVFVRSEEFLSLGSSGSNAYLYSYFEYTFNGVSRDSFSSSLEMYDSGFIAYLGLSRYSQVLNKLGKMYSYLAIKK